eukprot:m.130897 g.130897  ORF g.130897 m.130897 type:complete len:300 (-) comp14784_c0_seq3:22-921(-)
MAEAARPKRMRTSSVARDYVPECDYALILDLIDPKRKTTRSRTVFPAVCLSASRIRAASGEVIFEQHLSKTEKQELRRADAVVGEKIEFFVMFKDGEVAPSWEPSENVGTPLVRQYEHLLHVLPDIHTVDLSDIVLQGIKESTVRSIVASVSGELRDKAMSIRHGPRASACVVVELPVFLALFGRTKAFAGETLESLVGHGTTSRNITFAELDSVLGPACTAWHTRTNVDAKVVKVSPTKPVRLTLTLLNGIEFDHSSCPRCTFPADRPLCERPVHTSVTTRLFTAWQLRITVKYNKSH